MRKITELAVDAFVNGYKFRKDNTSVEVDPDGTVNMFLHGSRIAKKTTEGTEITLAGWNTMLTRERLNGIPGVNLVRKHDETFLNGSSICSSGWFKI